MQIHELKNKHKKKRKDIGRGGKRGTYSGRGNKGQKSRSGAKINPLFEGGRSSLIERLKKIRGFKSLRRKKTVFNLDDLDCYFQEGEAVGAEQLIKKGLLDKVKAGHGVKILGNGKINKKLEIEKDILLSSSARAAVEKAGGIVKSDANGDN